MNEEIPGETLEQEVVRLRRERDQAVLLRESLLKLMQEKNQEIGRFFHKVVGEVRRRKGWARHTIWFMYKLGEARTFAMTHAPSSEWAEIQKNAGYRIISFEVGVPDPADEHLGEVVVDDGVAPPNAIPESSATELPAPT